MSSPIFLYAQPSTAQTYADAKDATERWTRITSSDGHLVGYSHLWTSRKNEQRLTHSTTYFSMRVQGHPRNNLHDDRVVYRDGQNRVVRIERTAKSKTAHIYNDVRIKNGLAILESRDKGPKGRLRSRKSITLPNTIRFDMGAALIARQNKEPFDISFARLNLNNGKIENISIRQIADADRPDSKAARFPAVMRIFSDGKLRNIVSIKVDRQGHIIRRDQPISDIILTYKASDKAITSGMIDQNYIMPHPQIPSPYRISKSALSGKIRYQFGFVDDAKFTLPATGQQNITKQPDGVRIDICADCGTNWSQTADNLQKWRQPAAWMQSDWGPIKKAATAAKRGTKSEHEVMKSLMKLARKRIRKIDYSGHFSAKSAWQQRRGDCTEDALVLAALGRAAGIPTLVANGLAYSRQRYHGAQNAFIPHSWTLAYVDGRWRSYDMSLESFDAGHIALTIGEGSASDVAAAQALGHRLIWRSVAEIRTRQKTP